MSEQLLLFGPDSFWVNVLYGDRELQEDGDCDAVLPDPRPLDDAVSEALTEWQCLARQEEKPLPTSYEFDGQPLLMYPNGGGLTSSWRFILRNHALEVKVGSGKRNGIIAKVRFSAEYLWQVRATRECLYALHVFLNNDLFASPVFLQAGEVHLCADLAGYDFASVKEYDTLFIRRSGVRRHLQDQGFAFLEAATSEQEDEEDDPNQDDGYVAGPDDIHLRYRPITGFTFGSHKSAVSAVIYNKTTYIKHKAKTSTWFYKLWQEQGWDGVAAVWRIELRFKRQALHEMGIESAYDLVGKLHLLWQYGTGEWLRYVVEGTDSNRARWQSQEVWTVVRSASQQDLSTSQLEMEPIIREHKYVINVRQMVAQLVGCFITFRAWRKHHEEVCEEQEDISEAIRDFYPQALTYLDEQQTKRRKKSFAAEVRYKQLLYSQAAAQAVA